MASLFRKGNLGSWIQVVIGLNNITMDTKDNSLCRLHTMHTIKLGSCLTCNAAATVCSTSGCLKQHPESEKMHNTWPIKDIQQINEVKRNMLKKLVYDYFQLAKSEIEALYHQIFTIVEEFRFQNTLLTEHERNLANLLINSRYSDMSCSDIAQIIPKLLKCTSMEEQHYMHLKEFLTSEREHLSATLNSVVLNIPYFREHHTAHTNEKVCQISDELLSNVNLKLQKLAYKPRKVRIKYRPLGDGIKQVSKYIENRFLKLLANLENLRDIETLEMYCTWNINQVPFQLEFFDTILALPFLNSISIYTGYKVTTSAFIEEMLESKNIQLKIFKKDWHF